MEASPDHDHVDEVQEIQAYCFHCRQMVTLDEPQAVWTKQGMPTTRGTCPTCGNSAFRLGRTEAHDDSRKPAAVKVASKTRTNLPQEAIYINFAPEDVQMAKQIANDFERIGLACWMHEIDPPDVEWAGGVHPALKECVRMLLVLSPAAHHEPSIATAWEYFRSKNKVIVVAQVAPADAPDALRRKPRYDFTADYKSAFRQSMRCLTE
jgi:TIR domain/Domain of unknown function (DUF5679)